MKTKPAVPAVVIRLLPLASVDLRIEYGAEKGARTTLADIEHLLERAIDRKSIARRIMAKLRKKNRK